MASQDIAHNPMHHTILPLRWKAISLYLPYYDAIASAAFVSYDYGKQTFKAMLADTDNYGEVSYTPGWDYRHSDTVKYFVEYYAEEDTSAITAERAGSEVFDTDASGGRAIAAGVSLNFVW